MKARKCVMLSNNTRSFFSGLQGYTEHMKRAWRCYRFVAHVRHSNDDYDDIDRITINDCQRAHSPLHAVKASYEPVLQRRHYKSRAWRRRIASTVSGVRIKAPKLNTDNLLMNILSTCKEEGYVEVHSINHGQFICLTDKGERLRALPFGPIAGIAEYTFKPFPRTIAALGFVIILVYFLVWLFSHFH